MDSLDLMMPLLKRHHARNLKWSKARFEYAKSIISVLAREKHAINPRVETSVMKLTVRITTCTGAVGESKNPGMRTGVFLSRADDGIRTRDPHLGKVVL